MAQHLNDLDAEGASIDMPQTPGFIEFEGGKLVFGGEEQYLSKEQRQKLLALVCTEEETWSRDVDGRAKVVSHPQHAQILASWRLMKHYIEFLIARIEERERIMGETTEDLPKLLQEANDEIERLKRVLYGSNLVESLTGHNQDERCYRLSPDMIKQFRAFMELLKETPLAKSIFNFAQTEGLMISSHKQDGILESSAYEYKWKYADGYNEARTVGYHPEDKERFIDQPGISLARKWHEGGDSSGDRINPKVFYGGTVFDRVALRLLDELARCDEHFQCPMFFGTKEEGSALYTDSFAESLARKMWEMEKKWGCMSDDNRRRWLGAQNGWTDQIMPSGISANVIQLASYDYHSS